MKNTKAFHCDICECSFVIDVRVMREIDGENGIRWMCCPYCGRHSIMEINVKELDEFIKKIAKIYKEESLSKTF